MKRIGVAIVLVSGLLNCVTNVVTNEPVALHSTVYIDAEFTLEQQANIVEGLAAWHTAVPEVQLAPVIVSHAEAVTGRELGVHIVYNRKQVDDSCPIHTGTEPNGAGQGHAGLTGIVTEGVAVMCIAADIETGDVANWQTITAHEVGHALGLAHDLAPSVMLAGSDSYAFRGPNCEDVNQLHALRGTIGCANP